MKKTSTEKNKNEKQFLGTGKAVFEWELDKRIFHNGDVLRVGKWVVGEVCYESRTKGETQNYAAKTMLPGLKPTLDHYATSDLAKERVERAIVFWINALYVEKE